MNFRMQMERDAEYNDAKFHDPVNNILKRKFHRVCWFAAMHAILCIQSA